MQISELKSKLQQSPAAFKASFWFIICSILQKGVQLFTVPIFTRLLSTEQYGQFALYQTWYQFVNCFATLNLAVGVFNKGLIKYQDDREGFTSSIQSLATAITGGFFLLYLIAMPFWNGLFGLPSIVMLFMFGELLLSNALSLWTTRQRFEYKYKALVAVTLLISVLNPVIGLIAVHFSQERGVARILSCCAINMCVGLLFYIYNLHKGKKVVVKEYWKYALIFNLPLLPHYLSTIVLGQADRVMIEKMFGKSEVGIYSVAYSISMVMNVVLTSVNSSFVPWTYQRLQKKEHKQISGISNILLIVMAFISLLPVLAAPELIRIMAPAEYYSARWVIPPVAASVYFMFLGSLFANIEFYYEKTVYVMVISVLTAALNLLLNYIFMPMYGYIAAGYTTMVCYIIYAILHYIFMSRVTAGQGNQSGIYDMKKIVLISVIYVLATGLAMCGFDFPILRYGVILGGLLILGLNYKKIGGMMA